MRVWSKLVPFAIVKRSTVRNMREERRESERIIGELANENNRSRRFADRLRLENEALIRLVNDEPESHILGATFRRGKDGVTEIVLAKGGYVENCVFEDVDLRIYEDGFLLFGKGRGRR